MKTGRPRRSLELSTEERMPLESIAASRRLPHGLLRQAQMVLGTDSVMSNREAARRLKVSIPTVSFWRRRLGDRRLAGLHDELKPGRPRTHGDERLARLLKTALTEGPKAGTHWSVRSLGRRTAMSKTAVHRYLNLLGVQPHRSLSFKLSNDPFFIEKVRDIVGFYLNPPEHALVLALDAKSQIKALERTQPVLPLGLGDLEGATHDYVRHGTTTLFAALDVANGTVVTQGKPRHRHQEFLSFLRHIEEQVPAQLDVHLIVDNDATHEHPRVRSWLARRLRYHLHFMPTYSSWLNQVEIWCGQITRQAIRRGSFTSTAELRRKIEQFAEHWNQHPRPFTWTATADSIVAKLERLSEVIGGTQH